MTDKELSKIIGMTEQNLVRTYKKSSNINKSKMYQLIKIGSIVEELELDLYELEKYVNFRDIILAIEKNKKEKL